VAQLFLSTKAWSEQRAARSLAEEMAELRQLMQEEDYELTLPPRSIRPNAFTAACDD
jgi:hypothetical protein